MLLVEMASLLASRCLCLEQCRLWRGRLRLHYGVMNYIDVGSTGCCKSMRQMKDFAESRLNTTDSLQCHGCSFQIQMLELR
jgi:hypothetical protein